MQFRIATLLLATAAVAVAIVVLQHFPRAAIAPLLILYISLLLSYVGVFVLPVGMIFSAILLSPQHASQLDVKANRSFRLLLRLWLISLALVIMHQTLRHVSGGWRLW